MRDDDDDDDENTRTYYLLIQYTRRQTRAVATWSEENCKTQRWVAFPSLIFIRCSSRARLANYPTVHYQHHHHHYYHYQHHTTTTATTTTNATTTITITTVYSAIFLRLFFSFALVVLSDTGFSTSFQLHLLLHLVHTVTHTRPHTIRTHALSLFLFTLILPFAIHPSIPPSSSLRIPQRSESTTVLGNASIRF